MNKYQRSINGATVDVYDILKAYGVTCQATGHAIKKLLMPGQRGDKDLLTDLHEARQALDRAIELASPVDQWVIYFVNGAEPKAFEPHPTMTVGEYGASEPNVAKITNAAGETLYIR